MIANELKTIAQRLREYVGNPHHVDPMSEAFKSLIAEAAGALSDAAQSELAALREENKKVQKRYEDMTDRAVEFEAAAESAELGVSLGLQREAALREELEDYRRRVTNVNSQLAAANYELSETREAYLNQTCRLTDAEQRNAVMAELLVACGLEFSTSEANAWEIMMREKINAALKPTESGASE